MQTIKSVLEQFDVKLKLTDVILNKKIIGDFTTFRKEVNLDGELEYIFEGIGLFPRYHEETYNQLPEELRSKMKQEYHEENSRFVIIPENNWEHLRIESWIDGGVLHCEIYNEEGSQIGNS